MNRSGKRGKKEIIPIDLAGPKQLLLNGEEKTKGGEIGERNEKGAKKWECNVAH